MFEAVQTAILHAQHELARGRIEGNIIIELKPRDWDRFRHSLPTMVSLVGINADSPTDSCTVHGATVRLKK